MKQVPDIAGFYITDDLIDVVMSSDPDHNVQADKNIRIDVGLLGFCRLQEKFRNKEHPRKTVGRLIQRIWERLAEWQSVPHVRAICIGAYGPFESLTMGSKGYGRVRPVNSGRRMEGIDIRELFFDEFSRVFALPPDTVLVETDAACAALGESFARYTDCGVWHGVSNFNVLAFVKVSIGVGGAICQTASPIHGSLHSEMGQIVVRKWRDPRLDPHDEESRFEGIGSYPTRLESLISVPAIEARFGSAFNELKKQPEHAAWDRQAWYLSQLCLAIAALAAPSKIVLGGRVMAVSGLIDKVRREFRTMLGANPFPNFAELEETEYIDHDYGWTPNGPGRLGVVGALIVAAVKTRVPGLHIAPKES